MVDILQQGDYKVLLGDSLKDNIDDAPSHIGVKYNWVPKEGFGESSGFIRGSPDNISLVYSAGKGQYDYSGWISDKSGRTQLALIYDHEKSAFVLEKINASVEVNIQPSGNVSADQVKRHAQLKRPRDGDDGGPDHAEAGSNMFDDEEDEEADTSNPFDFRHFLQEAKEVTERDVAHTGAGTPLPGGRTPMTGFSSPHGAQALGAATPSFGPLEIVDSTNKEMREWPNRRGGSRAKKPTGTRGGPGRRKPAVTKSQATSQPKAAQIKSSEIVVDSDSDESDDTSDHHSPVAAPARRGHGHARNVSAVSAANEHDDDSDADNGSSPAQKSERPVSRQSHADIDMADADEEDEDAKYFQDDDEDEDQDADVDGLILDEEPVRLRSPSPELIKAPKPIKPHRKSSVHKSHRPRSPSPPGDDMDLEGGIAADLEAELEAALEDAGDDENEDNGVGLGIAVGGDDESDISEEE